MINPELQKARKVRDEYAAHNLNTKYQAVRIDDRTVVFNRIETDENAVKFAEKLKKLEKAEAIEKRVNKVQPNAIKKAKPKPEPKALGFSDRSLRTRIYQDFTAGISKHKIASKYGISINRVRAEIAKRKSSLGIPRNSSGKTYIKVVALIEKGLRNCEIAKELSVANHTVTYHRKRYLKTLQK